MSQPYGREMSVGLALSQEVASFIKDRKQQVQHSPGPHPLYKGSALYNSAKGAIWDADLDSLYCLKE